MQNYRNNAMPYNHYRQPQSPPQPKCDFYENKALAMAYVPWQTWQEIYDVEKALQRGTIFCQLDKPFSGKGGVKR